MPYPTLERLLRAGPLVGITLALLGGLTSAQAKNPTESKREASTALPSAFLELSATMQNRVCGELLTGLALGGVQAIQAQSSAELRRQDVQAQSEALYETGAQAVVLLTMAGSLSLPERLKAGEVTQAIEKMAPLAHVHTAQYCVQRVAAWVRAGQVDPSMMNKAYTQSRQLLDSALNSNDAQ